MSLVLSILAVLFSAVSLAFGLFSLDFQQPAVPSHSSEQGFSVNQVIEEVVHEELGSGITEQLRNLGERLSILEARDEENHSKEAVSNNELGTRSGGGSRIIKEQYIYLGDGETTNRDWTTIAATAVSLDPGDYQGLASVQFEAALAIEGGEASARLINLRSGRILTDTEVSYNRSPATWVSAPSIVLDQGRAEYAVQVRSSSGEKAILEGSRLRLEF